MDLDGVSSETYEFQVLDSVRRYLVLRPDGMDAGTVPTIIDFHGSGS
jgi:poly(3-hydroxybutyrate) depolymerase